MPAGDTKLRSEAAVSVGGYSICYMQGQVKVAHSLSVSASGYGGLSAHYGIRTVIQEVIHILL